MGRIYIKLSMRKRLVQERAQPTNLLGANKGCKGNVRKIGGGQIAGKPQKIG